MSAMRFLKNRNFAISLTAVLILLSVLLGVRKSLVSLHNDTVSVFEKGIPGEGQSISQILNSRISNAKNIITLSKRYLDTGSPLITDLSLGIDNLQKASGVKDTYNADNALTIAYEKLTEELFLEPLSDYDRTQLFRLKDELKSDSLKLNHNGYNEAAKKFNKILSSFPSNLLSKIVFVSKAELFG